jgi:site-specific recombinase XerD
MGAVRGIYEKVPKSGEWWIRYADSTGRIRREKAGSRDWALKLYRKRKTEVLQGKKLPETLRRKEASFAEIVKDALEYSEAHKRSYADDVCRTNRLLSWLGDRPAGAITPRDIERCLAEAAERDGLAPATLNRYRAVLSLIFRLAIRNDKVAQNPARLVRPQRENNARVRYLSADEEKRIREVIGREFHEHMAEFDLALHTGLRRGEMYGLTWADINFPARILTVPLSKNGERRHVRLNRVALDALSTLHQKGRRVGRVFETKGPRHWLEPLVERAGIRDFHWHDLRHTFASRAVMAGVDLRSVQDLLGHKSIIVTCRYSHLAPTHQLAAVESVADFTERQQAELAQRGPTEASTDTKTSTGLISAIDDQGNDAAKPFSLSVLDNSGRVAQPDRASDF